jgi:hypothetical protein
MDRFDHEDELAYAITSGAVAARADDADGLKHKQQRKRIGAGR